MDKNIIIIEDEIGIREGLKIILQQKNNLRIIADFSNAEEALEFLKNQTCDVVLMDIHLGKYNINGIKATQIIKNKYPKTHVIILTILEDSDKVFKALESGATGYLTKTESGDKIAIAIDEVCRGGSPMSPSIARKIVASFFKPNPEIAFTEREKEVLNYLKQGFSYKHIANQLYISTSTVKFHLQNIYLKLQVKNKHEAILKLNQHRFI